MGLLDFLRSDDDAERTYGGTPVDDLPQLPDKELRGTTVTLSEPRVAYKKVGSIYDEYVARLVVPAGATVVYPTKGRKLRADVAYVDTLFEVEQYTTQETDVTEAPSYHANGEPGGEGRFTYEEGTVAVPDDFDDSTREKCTHGIHLFRTEKRARRY